MYASHRPLTELLAEQLSSKKSIYDFDSVRLVWQKMYEASLGLQYLHRERFVHGSLSPRHLVVDTKGTVQVVYLLPNSSIQTQADEIRNHCFASDIRDFGMIIMGQLQTRGIKKSRSKPSDDFVVDCWSLIEHMCATSESDRITIDCVVQQIQRMYQSL